MQDRRRNRLIFWIGLAAVSLLYGLYYVFFLYGIAQGMPLRGRHVIKFLFVAVVYLVGALCLKGFAAAWMVRVWRMTYLVILFLLVVFGLFDWFVARTALELREIADNLLEFLVSPILYVAMRILGGRAMDGGARS